MLNPVFTERPYSLRDVLAVRRLLRAQVKKLRLRIEKIKIELTSQVSKLAIHENCSLLCHSIA